jgi:hypothetical protein
MRATIPLNTDQESRCHGSGSEPSPCRHSGVEIRMFGLQLCLSHRSAASKVGHETAARRGKKDEPAATSSPPVPRRSRYANASRLRSGPRYLASSPRLCSMPVQGCRAVDVPAFALACSLAFVAAWASFGAACSAFWLARSIT